MQLLVRLLLEDRPGSLSNAAAAIARLGGNILEMDVVEHLDGSVVDDFVVRIADGEAGELTRSLGAVEGIAVDCVRPTPQVAMHRELEIISELATGPRPSLELLARLVPAIVRCDWAVVISSAGAGVGITHASANGPRIRWTSLPWLPLERATTLEPDEGWFPPSLGPGSFALAAAPINATTTVLVGRQGGPTFRGREIERLAQLGLLAGRLLQAERAS